MTPEMVDMMFAELECEFDAYLRLLREHKRVKQELVYVGKRVELANEFYSLVKEQQ